MSLTILSATWGNVEQTAAVVVTQERGAVAISQLDRPNEWSEFQAWVAGGGVVSAMPVSTADTRSSTFEADLTRADLIDKLRNATLPQIDNYVDNNVTNIATARVLFKQILKVLALNVQR